MTERNSPVVELTKSELDSLSDYQIGIRVLAALAHTPSERVFGSYQAIIIVPNRDTAGYTAEDVLEADYNTIISQTIYPSDSYREKIGRIVREKYECEPFVLARS